MVSGGYMKSAYFQINEEKRKIIEQSAIHEFARHTFKEASLNQIVKNAGISKGGMFKYIEDKEDLYLYIFEKVLTEFIAFQNENINIGESCIIERLFEMLVKSEDFYIKNPLYLKLLLKGSLDFGSPCINHLMILRDKLLMKQHDILYVNVNWELYRFSKERVMSYLSTIMNGINMKILKSVSLSMALDIHPIFEEIEATKDIIIHGLKGVK